jgi:hypothetical protein
MTYDLGGGTFDVAIVEKRDGTISSDSVKAFDGDRFLGGYDFDEMLAHWTVDQLIARNYDLHLDLQNNATDRVIFAKIMVYAERAKIELSRAMEFVFAEPNTGITDHSGRPVPIDGVTITRDQFEKMIGNKVEETIEMCRRALKKAERPGGRNEIDEIIMVGGSSKIPLVSRRLEAEFGRKPKLIEPDLCVAIGAAILAGTKGKTYGRLTLDPVPTETFLPSLTITGRVSTGDGIAAAEVCSVQLRSADGASNVRRSTGPEGKFAFDGIPLAPEATTDFVLIVKSPSGVEVASHRFSVTHAETAKSGGVLEIPNVLSKPIGIRTVEGVDVVAPERTPLAYEVVTHAVTTDVSGEIRIPIVEGTSVMGEIVMKDIPTTLTVGSAVDITLTIQENYQIRGRAYVPAIGREATVVIDIPIPPQKSLEELRREYEEIGERADVAMRSASPGELFTKGTRLKKRMTDVEEMLGSKRPEPAKIQEALEDVDALARDIGRGWQPAPPRAVFEQKAHEAEDLLAAAIKAKPKVAEDGYDRQLAAIRSEAEKAYVSQNSGAWKESFEKVVKLCDRLDALAGTTDGGGEMSPETIVMQLSRALEDLEKWAREHGRYNKFAPDFEELADSLRKIDPKASDFRMRAIDWYNTKFANLKKRLQAPETTGYVSMSKEKR